MVKFQLFLKRHIALFIVIIIVLVFPISLSSQAKLSMRIIVTGLAIDKSDDGYEVTAQVVKSTPGTESPGTSASIDFVSEKGETISVALSKLMYRTGKVSAYSHTSFVIVGEDIAKEETTACLDIFIRDKIIRNSAMVLFAEGKAGDEIQKTKDIELSVGLGLQKVFLFKQEESDGLMTTVLQFLNQNKMHAKTAFASVISLGSNEEGMESSSGGGEGSSGEGSESGGQSGGGESGGSENSSSGGNESGGESGGSSGGGTTGGSGSSAGGGSGSAGEAGGKQSTFFKGKAPLMVFVDGKQVGKLEEDDEILGFMVSSKKTKRLTMAVNNVENEVLENTKISINIKDKSEKLKLRFEEEIPCIDVNIIIKDSEVIEILSKDKHSDIFGDRYDAIEKAIMEEIKEAVSKAFDKCKENGADMFGAYELAYKYQYNKLNKYYSSPKEFVKKLKLNVSVDIKKLDF